MPEYERLLLRLEQARAEIFAQRWVHGPETSGRLLDILTQDIDGVSRAALSTSLDIPPRLFCSHEMLTD